MQIVQTLFSVLGVVRLLIAPVLLFLAWQGQEAWFVYVFVGFLIVLVMELVVRRFNASVPLRERLLQLADVLTWLVLPVGAWLLFPHLIVQERFTLALLLIICFAGIVLSLFKTHGIARFGTWTAALAPLLFGVSVWVAFQYNYTIPFRIASMFQLFVAVEYLQRTWKHTGQ